MKHAASSRQRMFDWIVERLDADQPTPTDAEICDSFGFETTEDARTLLAELADAGRITIRGYGADRVVSLGRVRSAAPGVARPVPTVTKSDPVLDAGWAKISAILARGRKPSAPSIKPAPAAPPSPPARAATRPAAPLPSPRDKETAVPSQSETRQFTFSASGQLRAAIEARAKRDDISLGRAAQDLAEAGLAIPPGGDHSIDDAEAVLKTLADAPVRALLEELQARLDGAAANAELKAEAEAATARAVTAEAQLAAVRQALGQAIA